MKARITLIISILAIVLYIVFGIISNNKYDTEFGANWQLSKKTATIEQKSVYIDKFVQDIEKGGFGGKFDAIFNPNDNNSYEQNLIALKTLQQRLHELKSLPMTSFDYNTALQQLSEQQGDISSNMIYTFSGIWYKEHYILLWNWICFVGVIFFIILIICSWISISEEW
jgi:hypothetical protein